MQRHFAAGAICIIKIGRIHASYETIKTRKGAETEFLVTREASSVVPQNIVRV